MVILATVVWIGAMTLGAFMLLRTVAATNQTGDSPSLLPTPLVFGHGFAALVSFAIWLLFIVRGDMVLAWTALGGLVLVAMGGLVMFTRWARTRRWYRSHGRSAPYAEQTFPAGVVAAHGALAATTIVLVLTITLLR